MQGISCRKTRINLTLQSKSTVLWGAGSRGEVGTVGQAPAMPDGCLTSQRAGEGAQLEKRPHQKAGLGRGAAFRETYLNEWQKSITEEGASMTKRSHGVYSDRMINFSLLIQNVTVWGEFKEMFDPFKHWLFEEELLHKSKHFFYHLWFELAQQELSDSQVEPLQNLSTIGAPSFKARSQYLRHLRGSDLLSSCYTLWHPDIPPHPPCPPHVFRCLEVLLTSWAQACKWRNHDCNCSTAWLRGPDSHLITTWLLPTWGTLLWISLKKQNSALLLMTSTSRGSSFHVLHLKCYSGSSVCWCHPSTAAEPEIKRERWNSAFTLHTQDHT